MNAWAIDTGNCADLDQEDRQMDRRMTGIAVLGALLVSQAWAQQIVYPAKGQTPNQQKSDEAACYSWAVQQTGYDPAKPPATPPPPAQPTTATGTTPGAGARGAARGAVVGEIVADDARSGAAVGAVAARGQSRRQNAAQANATQQQQSAAVQQQQATFGKARAACLEGRGYTVK
ncbi:MAG TPA: hypothetical protein VFK10_04065 [Burkholderiaceae bacterium]|nr:hypothetical protein [Burkholderiaceae bacterium]